VIIFLPVTGVPDLHEEFVPDGLLGNILVRQRLGSLGNNGE
jgi:hypothetical protein